MMRTVDEGVAPASPNRVFSLAAEVERWPKLLPHYRWVRMLEGTPRRGLVEMAAWRPFGIVRWPTWWVSEMEADPERGEVRYRHVRGITTGMEVLWQLTPHPEGTRIVLTHDWAGPNWPLIRRPAAEWIIGPVFVHGIASRTVAGLVRAAAYQHG